MLAKSNEIRGSKKATWLGKSIGWFALLTGKTCRFSCEDRADVCDLQRNEPVIFLLWHNRIFSSIPLWKKFCSHYPLVALASASKDGAILAGAVGVVGVEVVRGSSSRRGAAALVALRKALKQKKDIFITPDGPRGPRYQMQMGALKLAQITGVPIVMKLVREHSFWQLKTWDLMRIPKPFSKLELVYEERIHVPKDLSDSELEELRCSVEAKMNRLNETENK